MATLNFGDLAQVDATIANAASLSGAVDLGSKRVFALQMPSAWTAAALTFQGSMDGTTYNDIYGSDGTELTVAAAASRYVVLLDPATFQGVNFLKVRSGTAAAPVNQGAARALKLVTMV